MTQAPDRKRLLSDLSQRLSRLSPERLRVASDFLLYLEEREDNDATAELLSIPGFEQAHASALAEVARGDTVPFRQIRRDA
jgi:hypothetical protein